MIKFLCLLLVVTFGSQAQEAAHKAISLDDFSGEDAAYLKEAVKVYSIESELKSIEYALMEKFYNEGELSNTFAEAYVQHLTNRNLSKKEINRRISAITKDYFNNLQIVSANKALSDKKKKYFKRKLQKASEKEKPEIYDSLKEEISKSKLTKENEQKSEKLASYFLKANEKDYTKKDIAALDDEGIEIYIPKDQTVKKDTVKQSFYCLKKKSKPVGEEAVSLMNSLNDVLSIDKKDSPKWKIKFYFGFSKTKYHTTDVDVKSSSFTGKIKDVDMYERTSAHYYNPKNWDEASDAFKWIDEPTNTYQLSLEKGKNIIYLTAYHPKYLKSILYKESQDGIDYQEGAEDNRLNQDRPDGYSHFYIQNTHKNMVWQVGYGRAIHIIDGEKSGTLSYIPKADVGISTGAARSAHLERDKDGDWDFKDHTEKTKVQGLNASVGHRLEYTKGKVSLFVDQKTIFSKLKHEYLDGEANYNLRMSPVTFGAGISIFDGNKKKK